MYKIIHVCFYQIIIQDFNSFQLSSNRFYFILSESISQTSYKYEYFIYVYIG